MYSLCIEKDKRNCLFQFLLTKEELNEIKRLAEERHMSASAFIRYRVLSRRLDE